jgi:hypothetical protein
MMYLVASINYRDKRKIKVIIISELIRILVSKRVNNKRVILVLT